MRFKTNKLSCAVLLAILGNGFSVGSAMAQEAEPQGQSQSQNQGQVLESIRVTGTRIQSQTMTASSPVAEIEREAFTATGSTRAEDLVNQYPQMSASFDSFENNGAVGYPTVDLRALGAHRTLTLVNGHRLPMGVSEYRDISIVPAALIKRVDLLSGGASAVYGSDAIAGVVNFVLDTDFEGLSINVGTSAYRHSNNNGYIRGLMDQRGYQYPRRDSGFDGASRNVDVAFGGKFGDDRGHAMAWLSWRQNNALMQGERDYSSCALNAAGTACGGSATAANPNFLVTDSNGAFDNWAHYDNVTGKWSAGIGELYNFAPINYYQRPDTRYNFGAAVRYDVNDHLRPYAEFMYINRKSNIQVAESGTFFGQTLNIDCSNALINTMCSDLGIDPASSVEVYVGKRNVEGGPRNFEHNSSSWRMIVGAEGDISDNWTYNASYAYSRSENTETARGDFLSDRVASALLGCPAGSFSGCVPYNVWQPGGVTVDAARALEGIGMQRIMTTMKVLNGYVSGDLGFGFASAGHDPIKLAAGYEWRKETYNRVADENMATGNFTGSGGPSLPLAGEIRVNELFMEAAIPVLASDDGFVRNLTLDLGARTSDYSTSGRANTWKAGVNADFGNFRIRGGFNKAIRAPSVSELFSGQQISLFAGEDPCAGSNPTYTAAQCALMGVTPAQYGNISASPAGQYNQFSGGNLNLDPEQAKTWTLGVAFSPIENLNLSIDMYDIKMEDRISTIGAQTILDLCGLSGNPTLCGFIHRHPTRGDLWIGSDLATSGYVQNLTGNFGTSHHRGVDLTASYVWNLAGGRLLASFTGSRLLKAEYDNLPGVDGTAYDCVGKFNNSCQSPKWRHIANLNYGRDNYSVNLRWRHTASMNYVQAVTGAPLTTDTLLVNNGNRLSSWNVFDLSGTIGFGPMDVTVGVNNIADKEPPMVGSTLAVNGNSPAGYDQAGRYFFTNFAVKF